MQQHVRALSLMGLILASTTLQADPWWTGPLLAPGGHTIPAGHTNFEMYGFYNDNDGIYNRHWKFTHSAESTSLIGNPVFTHGLADRLDIQYGVPYSYNRKLGKSYHHISDTGVTLGYQLLEQNNARWRPDVRFTLGEIIPTGKFEGLMPVNNGTDSTGLGSYQTVGTLIFQLQTQFNDINYLRTRLSFNYAYAANTGITGVSSYGGLDSTRGTIDPGDLFSVDLAGEFSLNQNWVLVMEGYFATRQAVKFSGYAGMDAFGNIPTIGSDSSLDITMAPAIEYNFSPNLGIIAGSWFTVTGKEAAEFRSIVIAVNAYW